MNFTNKLNFCRLGKIAAIAAVSGTIFFGGNSVTSAAVQNEGIAAFREAYMEQITGTRMVDQDLTLIGNSFHLDIDSKARITADGTFIMGGELNWTYTNLQKNYSTNNDIPFFISQVGNEMTLYVKRNGTWSKMLLPGLPSGIAVLWRSNEPAMLEEIMQSVKTVEILNDTPDIRIMNVTLDGNKIADILSKNSEASFAKLSGDALTSQREIFKRWIAAIKAKDNGYLLV